MSTKHINGTADKNFNHLIPQVSGGTIIQDCVYNHEEH